MENEVRRYGPTSGLVTGWIGLAGCALLAVGMPFTGQDQTTLRVAVGAALAGVVIWMIMLRPNVILTSSLLELRNPLTTWQIPVGLVDAITVGVVARVEAAGRSYDAVAVGRPVRVVRRNAERPWGSSDMVADRLTEDVLHAAATARAVGQETGIVQRLWAVPELSAIGVLSLVLLVLLV